MQICAELRVYIIGVDVYADFGRVAAARVERDIVQNLFKHRVQPARADVFIRFVRLPCVFGDRLQCRIIEIQRYAVHAKQQFVLADQGVFGLGQNALVIFDGQRLQIHAHGEAPLQFGDQIGNLRHVESACGDEQDMIRLDRTVFGIDRGALHDRQNIALHALAGYVRPRSAAAARHLIDFIQKYDAVLLRALDGLRIYRVHVDQILLLLGLQNLARLAHLHLAQLGFLRNDAAQHIAHVHIGAGNIRLRANLFDLDFNDFVLQLAAAKARAHIVLTDHQLVLFLGGKLRLPWLVAQQNIDRIDRLFLLRAGQQIHQPILRNAFGAAAHACAVLILHQTDRCFHQIADDGFHIAPHIAHLGELRGLHLYERRVRQPRQPAGDFGLAHAGRADHQYVLRGNFFADRFIQPGAAIAVAQRDRDGALGVLLTDDVSIQLAHDLAGGKFSHIFLLIPFQR